MEAIGVGGKVRVAFSELADLASEAVGGKVLFASDDFFAEKENLLKSQPAIFTTDKYTSRGKWMDGWESRRKRVKGFDHCIIQLGLPGEIEGVNIDTSFFTGNFPEYASIEAVELAGAATLKKLESARWTTILPKSALAGGSFNYFPIRSSKRWTHLKLNIFPDGGVARFRVHGHVRPEKKDLKGIIDLAALETGATVITANDSYFGPKDNLIFPGRAENMGGGWETRRKRGPGHDWLILKLCGRGKIKKIQVDTNHFKGNFPDRCSIDGLLSTKELLPCDFRDLSDLNWVNVLPEAKLKASTIHNFEKELINLNQKFTYVRLNIFPDGGVSRFRVWGTLG